MGDAQLGSDGSRERQERPAVFLVGILGLSSGVDVGRTMGMESMAIPERLGEPGNNNVRGGCIRCEMAARSLGTAIVSNLRV